MQTSSRDLGRASIVFDILSCPAMSRKLRGNDSHKSILFVKVIITVRGIAKHHKMWQYRIVLADPVIIILLFRHNGVFPDTLDPLGNLSLGRDNSKAVQACGGFICRQSPQKPHFQIHCGRISISMPSCM